MKVFISWSGELSQQLGTAFKDWIPDVLQAVHPYFTPEDIKKGERWNSEIARELEESKFGIFCVTRENLSSGWMNFEAGAISKNKEASQVCPILFGLQPTDVVGPLQQFQATVFSKDDIFKLMKAINAKLAGQALSEDRLERQFERMWPHLEDMVSNVLASQNVSSSDTPIRGNRELLEEILTLVREIKKCEQRETENQHIINDKDYAEYKLIMLYIDIVNDIKDNSMNISDVLQELQKMQKFFFDIVPYLQIQRQKKVMLLEKLKKLIFTCPESSWNSMQEVPF